MLINFDANTVCSKPVSSTDLFSKSAVCWRFFVLATCLFVQSGIHSATVQSDRLCQIKLTDAKVHIDHVIDGDTVALANGQNLRLIGIDTPEINYKSKSPEPGAIEARDFLKSLIRSERSFRLSYDLERRDRHNRTLGYLFFEDGRNIQALLLAQGYATPLNIPPNISYSVCHRQMAQLAIAQKLGLWQLKQYQAVDSILLTENDRGYRVVYGSATNIGQSSSSLWLNLANDLAIHIRREELKYFPGIEPESLAGKLVQVRGKLYFRNKQLRMRLRHQSDLEILRP